MQEEVEEVGEMEEKEKGEEEEEVEEVVVGSKLRSKSRRGRKKRMWKR